MFRVGKWLERSTSSRSISTLDPATEAQNMEVALRAAELIMDDDIPGAEAKLSHGDSAFHKLAKGTLGFMKATLGFEQDIMKEATTMLGEAETSAYQFHQRSQHDPHAFTSTIYERGAEFALCQAEAQIMNAVVGVLNESLTESIRGFYKIRKAYITLDGLAQQEANFMRMRGDRSAMGMSRQQSSDSVRSVRSFHSNVSTTGNTPIIQVPTTVPEQNTLNVTSGHPSALRSAHRVDEDDSDDEFVDANTKNDQNGLSKSYEGRLGRSEVRTPLDEKMHYLAVSPAPSQLASGATTPVLEPLNLNAPSLLTADADSEIFKNSLDVFIHSGVNLMSGLINLMISVIPPAFSKLLSIIGFRGDRERGLRMLWQASKFSNINGGMAALMLFMWYNGVIGFCDIITDSDPTITDDVNGFPKERLQALLVEMRQRYPKSFLWKLEEARAFSNERQIDKALEILCRPEKAQMKQLEALHQFEKSLDAMNAHRYELCAQSFITCIDLNGWSQALYYHAAAAAHLQLYRDLKDDPTKKDEAKKNRDLAEKYFKIAPTVIGKKKMMGRQLPFDNYVVRKNNKWTDRATMLKCDFIDAIGVAPLEEISMLWNGYKKMDEKQLQKSLTNLAWSSEKNPHWDKDDTNERAIQAVLTSICLRNLRRHEEAKAVLTDVLAMEPAAFKGIYKDDWMGPAANYEMAANFWMQRDEYVRRYGAKMGGIQDTEMVTQRDISHDAALVAEAKKYIEKAKAWGSFELDTRIGMKITAGHAAIGKWEVKHKGR